MVPPIDYETLKIIWWLLLGLLLVGFMVTDGFDMGAGALLPFAGRNDEERRLIINTVGPVWEGNQVWFVLGGGAIFAAWPPLYALAFSGFYVAMFLVLAALIVRPVSFVFRSKNKDPRWRAIWDGGLFVSGIVPPLVFGIAMGNVLQGVPFRLTEDLRPVYEGSFAGLLNPFALLCGLLALAMVIQHGAAWLVLKTEGDVARRARHFGAVAGVGAVALFAICGAIVWAGLVEGYVIRAGAAPGAEANPLAKTVAREAGAWAANLNAAPGKWLGPLVGLLGLGVAAFLLQFKRGRLALVASGLGIAGVIATPGLAMFPFILPSSSNPSMSLTVWDASSSHLTLFLMLIATLVFMPLIIAYTSWVYYVIRGKVSLEALLASRESY